MRRLIISAELLIMTTDRWTTNYSSFLITNGVLILLIVLLVFTMHSYQDTIHAFEILDQKQWMLSHNVGAQRTTGFVRRCLLLFALLNIWSIVKRRARLLYPTTGVMRHLIVDWCVLPNCTSAFHSGRARKHCKSAFSGTHSFRTLALRLVA